MLGHQTIWTRSLSLLQRYSLAGERRARATIADIDMSAIDTQQACQWTWPNAAAIFEYNAWAFPMGHKYREHVCSCEPEWVERLKRQYVRVPDTDSHSCIDHSPKVSLARQKCEIALASAFSYTHVLQDGGQYTDLYREVLLQRHGSCNGSLIKKSLWRLFDGLGVIDILGAGTPATRMTFRSLER